MRDIGLVRDQHDRAARARSAARRSRAPRAVGVAVEVAGRLVGEDDRGIARDRARDRDPLLLATRQLRRHVLEPIAQPDRFERGDARADGARAFDTRAYTNGSSTLASALVRAMRL